MTNVIEDIVRENIKRLIDTHDEGNQSAACRRCQIPQKTIHSICSGRAAASLSSIELIAAGYWLEPWMLLIRGLDPRNPPVLTPVSPAEKDFYAKMKAAFESISKQ